MCLQVGAVSLWGNSPRCTKEDKMFGRLVKWCVTMLIIVVVGTVLGWAVAIFVAAVPLWGLVVILMVVLVLLFKFTVWAISEGGW